LTECNSENRSVVIIFPDVTRENRDESHFRYLVNKLGGSLFTKGSKIIIFRTDYHYVQKTYPIPSKKMDAYVEFQRSDVMMNSQYTMKPLKRFGVKGSDIRIFLNDLLKEGGVRKTTAVIWLIDEPNIENETLNQINTFRNMSSTEHFNYLLVKDTNLRTDVATDDRQLVKTIKLRQLDMLNNIGNKLFPEICNGNLF
jgi:hypothetical protein